MLATRRRFLPFLGLLRQHTHHGKRWAKLVESVASLPVEDPRVIAFRLMMDRLRRRQPDGHAYEPLCAECAARLIRAFEGDEDNLITFYYRTLTEVNFTTRHMQAAGEQRRQERLTQMGRAA